MLPMQLNTTNSSLVSRQPPGRKSVRYPDADAVFPLTSLPQSCQVPINALTVSINDASTNCSLARTFTLIEGRHDAKRSVQRRTKIHTASDFERPRLPIAGHRPTTRLCQPSKPMRSAFRSLGTVGSDG